MEHLEPQQWPQHIKPPPTQPEVFWEMAQHKHTKYSAFARQEVAKESSTQPTAGLLVQHLEFSKIPSGAN